jgi:RNA polymerase sigma-70 factor (ECF subfamily)
MLTFEEIYQTHFPDVHRFALWLTHDHSLADDVVSETFIRAWARREKLRTESLKGYLLAIARNVFLNHRARHVNFEALPEDLHERSPDPERRTASRAELDHISRMLSTLPELDRTALILRSELGLPYAEIARVLEISEGAARVRIHRARRRLLAESLEPIGGNP